VDEVYALLRVAGTRKQPVAMYEGHPRLFCPHLWVEASEAGGTHSVISLEEQPKAA
jgi:hypothetical protein